MPVPYTDVHKKEQQELCLDTDGGKTGFFKQHAISMDKTNSMNSSESNRTVMCEGGKKQNSL